MATVFETRLIGNIGKDATVNHLDNGVLAINFPVAHNKNWKDKRSGEQRTKTTWINCTIWKREGANLRIVDFLKKGTLVEIVGTPIAKAHETEEGQIRSEIRLHVNSTNILRTPNLGDHNDEDEEEENEDNYHNYSMSEEDFNDE